MRRVAQLIDSRENGDCFRACVASVLELDPHDLPNVGDPVRMRTTTRVGGKCLSPHHP